MADNRGSGDKHGKQQTCQKGKDTDSCPKEENRKRKRTKRIEAQLKDQMEFYFGDSNLQKDRFLKQAISESPDGYVSVKTIADFNRMKQLTNDISLVINAIKSSSLLQLNDDESMVKRTTLIPEARNVDAETVYVEKLPPNVDHDWLRKVFSQFGKVTYVSLPRFKYTGDIKGFAFVEFETPNEADKAVQGFKKEKEEKENGQQEEQLKPKRRKRSHSESEADDKQPSKTERKRRRTISESSADSHDSISRIEPMQLKKEQRTVAAESQLKLEATKQGDDSLEEGKETRKRKKSDKAVHWKSEDDAQNTDEATSAGKEQGAQSEEDRPSKKARSSESESNTENTEEERSKKKKKKRKRKAKEKKESKLPFLRVISKLEWLRLKEEYKQLQRQSMQELKKQLQECHEKELDHDKDEKSNQRKNQTKGKETDKKTAKSSPEELPFTPGVVLHFKSVDTEIQKKDIRDKLALHAPVAYVDLTDESGEGYVRFHTPDNCTTVLDKMSDDSSSGLKLVKLTGQEERDYWKKINNDRVARFQAKREKKRGTEKVAKKAEALQVHQQATHIRFDDD